MRFLFLTQYFPPETGATQTRLAALSEVLVRLGHHVEVVTTLPNHPLGRIFPQYRKHFYVYEVREQVPVHRVWVYASMGKGIKRAINYVSFTLTCLFGLLRAKKPDVIFVESPPPSLAVSGLLASRVWRLPLILNIADLWPDSARELGVLQNGLVLRLSAILESWAYRRADFINAVTDGIRNALVHDKGVPERKLLRLYNGVDTNLFRSFAPDAALKRRLGLEHKKIVLHQGTMGYAHALETALLAAELLRASDIHFVFLGNGSEKANLVRLANKLALSNVTFIDAVPIEEVPRYFSIACCGLASARNVPVVRDARPAKLLPIMASGKPAIFYGVEGETTRMIRDARAGIVVDPDDPEALAKAIQTIADSPALAEEFGKNGRCYAERFWTWSELAENWLGDLSKRLRVDELTARQVPDVQI